MNNINKQKTDIIELVNQTNNLTNIVMFPNGSTIEVSKSIFYDTLKKTRRGSEPFMDYLTKGLTYRFKWRANGHGYANNDGSILGYVKDDKYYLTCFFITWIHRYEGRKPYAYESIAPSKVYNKYI